MVRAVSGLELPLRHVDVDGARVAYVEAGEGEVVVLVHGYPESHAMWRHQIPELAKTHRVVAIDWFGWGDSERVVGPVMRYEREVERLGRLLDALDIRRCTLVAHDYGGYLALGFVLAHPERVARFGILNSRAHETFNRSGFWATWLVSATARVAPWLLTWLPLENIHRLGLEPYQQAGCFDAAQVDRYVGWMGDRSNRQWFARFFAGYSLRPRREQLEALRKVDIPTAVIWGSADPWCPIDIADELVTAIPNATRTTIARGLHYITEHKPDEVTAALRELLARSPSPETAEPPAIPPPVAARASKHYRGAILAGWSWLVCGVLVVLGLIGLFTEELGPVRTNQVHALALNLSVGLLGFAFARFALEHLFVLASGIGMVTVSLIGFNPGSQDWMYRTFNLNATSSWVELASGAISLLLWLGFHPRRSAG